MDEADEAIDTFAELVRQRDELRAENERLRERLADAENAQAALDKLRRAENERLRAAIEAYLENDSQANWDALAALVGDRDG
jgi:cell shape-determining protein MreC